MLFAQAGVAGMDLRQAVVNVLKIVVRENDEANRDRRARVRSAVQDLGCRAARQKIGRAHV